MINLRGLRVLNTRPVHQNSSLCTIIRQNGGRAVELPAIQIQPLSNDTPYPLAAVDQVIFTSANAVAHYVTPHLAAIWPETLQVNCIGQATALAVAKHKIIVHHIPTIENSEQLLEMAHLQAIRGQVILLIKGKGGRTLIAETLQQRTATVIPIETYQRLIPTEFQSMAYNLWRNDDIDVILFTSSEAMYNLFIIFGEQARTWLCSKPCVVFSARLVDTAKTLGIKTIIALQPHQKLEDVLHHIQGSLHD